MTASDLARMFHGRKAGHYKGRPAWQARCPIHRDRSPSLSITEPRRGRAKVHCFRGCEDEAVLAAKGLTIGDLYADKRTMTPGIWRQIADEDRLKLTEWQLGLAIMAQAVLPKERHYWKVVEQNLFERQYDLRCTLYPSEKADREWQHEVQRIIAEYGWDELWECVP